MVQLNNHRKGYNDRLISIVFKQSDTYILKKIFHNLIAIENSGTACHGTTLKINMATKTISLVIMREAVAQW